MNKVIGLLSTCLLFACVQGDQRTRTMSIDRQAGPVAGSLPLRNVIHFAQTGSWLVEPRILGGREAVQGQDPWQVALVYSGIDRNFPFCGGSLIRADIVVTAAHCVDQGTMPDQVNIVAGAVDLDQPGQRVSVSRIIMHPNYNIDTKDNDIALLHLSRATTSGGTIAPATDAIDGAAADTRTMVRVTGWGRTENSSGMVRKLRTVDVPLVPRTNCNDRVSYRGRITNNMICAGWQRGGQDSCQGDSGGPLTIPSSDGRALLGVVSWGHGCAQPNKYGVYTRVANYTSWIASCSRPGGC